jgi:1-acyl-sn-glycerol-3-phosphate acyltransferase
MIALIKFFFVFLVIFVYFLSTAPFFIFLKKYPYGTKKILNHIVGIYSKVLTWILGIKISHNLNTIDRNKNYFIVSNHLSYIDILLISSVLPTSFVTSVEMKNTPFLGQIIQLAGCLFVERRNKKNIMNEIGDIENALNKGLNVTVFPEATSTNGEQVLKFKRSLFMNFQNS